MPTYTYIIKHTVGLIPYTKIQVRGIGRIYHWRALDCTPSMHIKVQSYFLPIRVTNIKGTCKLHCILGNRVTNISVLILLKRVGHCW